MNTLSEGEMYLSHLGGGYRGVGHTFDVSKVHTFRVIDDLNMMTTLKKCYEI